MIGKSRTVQVQATLTNRRGVLKAGMYAGIRVTQQQRVAVLTVPETALTYTPTAIPCSWRSRVKRA